MDIKIEYLENVGNITVVAKGHFQAKPFIDAYMEMTGDTVDERPEEGEVRQVYMRKTPRDGYVAWWTECQPGKGAFAVTAMGPF